jgi:hypothetical protein
MPSLPARALLSIFTITALAACAGDEVNAPPDPVEGTLTVDATDGWTYVSLAEEGTVAVTDPATSTAWDLAFNATNVMVNGGAAGPAGVGGFCVCANAAATNDQVLAMTAESELDDFDAVESTEGAAYVLDELVPAIAPWHDGEGASAVADGGTWLLRLRNGTSFAKLRVVSLTGPSATDAGELTVEYAVQTTAADAFGPTETVVLDAGAGATLDLIAGGVDGAEWDIAVDGFTIRVNGGVSGTGQVAAAVSDVGFESVTTASTDPRAYRTDTFGGVFTDHPWYRYNLTGEHGIHPTYDVYLIRRGGETYKVQILDYYGPTGEPRQITMRYAQLQD